MVRSFIVVTLVASCLAIGDGPERVSGCSAPGTDARQHDDVQRKVARIVADSRTYEEGNVALKKIPEDQLVPAVIDAITRGVYEDEKTRGRCYWILSDYGAVKSEDGYKPMLSCLDDSPVFLGLCAGALTQAPAEKLPEVAERLATILTKEKTSLSNQEIVLKAMAKIGKPAVGHLATVEGILTNPQADDRIRAFAAIAVLNIGGAKRAIEILPKLDRTGLRESMGPLGTFTGETQGTFDTDDKETRDKMRSFMRMCMQNDDPRIREVAAQGFVLAYSKDELWIGNAESGFKVNPGYREPWELMARNDPVERLRDGARQQLERIEKAQVERNRK